MDDVDYSGHLQQTEATEIQAETFDSSCSDVDDVNEGRPLEEGEAPEIPPQKFEYLDHTADVQLHAWGESLQEAFEQIAISMFNYMTTNFDTVEMLSVHEIQAEGEDMMSLLFHFLDEFLFLFSADPYIIPRVVKITEFDMEKYFIKAEGYGEPFDISKHPQGTEVKAITYSNMQIHSKEDRHDLFVIIDI